MVWGGYGAFVCFLYRSCINFFHLKVCDTNLSDQCITQAQEGKFKSRLNLMYSILSINCCQLLVPLLNVLNLF